MPHRLYYFHDPMCSWCWAFRPVWHEIATGLPEHVTVRRVLGGLAPDTNQPMPAELQLKLKEIWQKIQQTVPGTQFNFTFWDVCIPRRSTYAACRAAIAARKQDFQNEEPMILAIQQAYYRDAKNPADISTLIELADKLGLDCEMFRADIASPSINQILLQEIEYSRRHHVQGFPSIVLKRNGEFIPIQLDYRNAQTVLHQIKQLS